MFYIVGIGCLSLYMFLDLISSIDFNFTLDFQGVFLISKVLREGLCGLIVVNYDTTVILLW